MSSEWGQGPWWVLRVNAIWCVSLPTVSHSPIQLPGDRDICEGHHTSSGGSKVRSTAILGGEGERQNKGSNASSPLPPCNGTCACSWIADIFRLIFFCFFLFYCEHFFKAFLGILLWTIFMTESKSIQREMFPRKCTLSISLCISIKSSERFSGINPVDNVTLESFISAKDCTFSICP